MATLIASRLRQLALESGWDDDNLAFALGWTVAKFRTIFDGRAIPDYIDLLQLARHFNRRPSWLYYGDEPVPVGQRASFETLDNLWGSAVENERTEEMLKDVASKVLEGAGKRRMTRGVARSEIDAEFGCLIASGQYPYSHYYEEQ